MSRTTARQKLAAAVHYICQSRDEAAESIAEIGRCQRERDRIAAAMNDELAAVRARHEAEAKPHADRIAELTRGVHDWCEANRARLTNDGKVKTHAFATGEIKWRLRPFSIAVRGVDAVIALLKQKKKEWVRTTEAIDKEAMLKSAESRAEAALIPGVKVEQKEDFVVVPDETRLEEVQS